MKSEVWSFKSVTFRTVHFRTMHARTGRADVRAHASSIDDKGLSYGITLRQLPPSCGYYWYCVFATPISSCETHALVTLKLKYCHVPSRSSFAAWTMRTLFFQENYVCLRFHRVQHFIVLAGHMILIYHRFKYALNFTARS